MRHSSGPFRAVRVNGVSPTWSIVGPNAGLLADVYHEKNVELFAAATDMAEALKAILAADPEQPEQRAAARISARAALAKAGL